jgi:ParB family chromosome partitioning protein
MAPDHDDRRRLARAAVADGWTVRETESRAREAAGREEPAPGRRAARRPAPHPDQVEAASRLGDAFGRALGAEVRVAPRGEGYKLTLDLGSWDDAMALAERLGAVEPSI